MTTSNWQISADTGGTFTDCFGIPPGADSEDSRLVKVLSSGILRAGIAEHLDPKTFRLDLPENWKTPDGFFKGYAVSVTGFEANVTAWTEAGGILHLDQPVPGALTAVDLSIGEEAPVIGARLLTGTGLSDDFPPIDFRLGTTRGTNALLERKGAPVAFFVTRGFRDLLEIRDQRRPDLFALEHRKPLPLYESAVEVDERIAADGSILTPLDPGFEAEARAALDRGVRVAAIALLHSYVNPAHERTLRDRLLKIGFEHVSLSSELAPLIKILPRAETAVVDAYLTPVMQAFVDHIAETAGGGQGANFLAMNSAGGLEPANCFRPKDSLLSGPAGGVVGAATAGRALGFEKIITFDMGGTSTDVARFDRDFLYRFEQKVGDVSLLSPALKIETVASGGGSICRWTEAGLRVGPESAGADPGPACYGRGGPLTITDVNLLLGRIDLENFGIPLGEENLEAAREALRELADEMGRDGEERIEEKGERSPEIETESDEAFSLLSPDSSLLGGLAAIATEQMADAIRTISIRDGADPSEYSLVAFGGAGPLHACEIAERLGMKRIIVPREAGLLSAFGIHHAAVERFAERQILEPLGSFGAKLPAVLEQLANEAKNRLEVDLGDSSKPIEIRRQLADLRLAGQDASLTIEISDPERIGEDFRTRYRSVFGYDPPVTREIELVSLRVIASTVARHDTNRSNPVAPSTQPSSIGSDRFVDRSRLAPGSAIPSPAIIQDPFSTLWLKEGWSATVTENRALVLELDSQTAERSPTSADPDSPIIRELFRHRFENLVGEMGAMLQRSAISTNVKERADFSCALLDANGELVVNAPHIPVHLGALGLCVRMVAKTLPMGPGDVVITNHPGFGGSHLPDVTLITPVFSPGSETLIGYVANRAHHAEIGGISPGSMPADARNLAEEGVVIAPDYLFRRGESRIEIIADHLAHAPFPTRHLADNLADIHAQAAANRRGAEVLSTLVAEHGDTSIRYQLESLAAQSQDASRNQLQASGFTAGEGIEKLDDGTGIRCRLTADSAGRLTIDFTGTAPSHPGNLNATPAILRSAVLYGLRLWTQSELPLNEGLLRNVEIILPPCFLNPEFPENASECPAVVGGNVETSQRIVDTLLKILGIQAGSQGTMNNFIFGDESFGYYETIGGGAGAGPDYGGASGLHTHMTNTAITDPEILEHRYPIRLRQFSIRRRSGGAGIHCGGDGLIREVEFLKPLRVSLLTQHRVEKPCGLDGGEPGKPGRQQLRHGGETRELPEIVSLDVLPGDVLKIETPGGGGCGRKTEGD